MFYNRAGMVLFIAAYSVALAYSGLNLSFLNTWGGRGYLFFTFWILFGATLPLGLLRRHYSSQLLRLGGVALTFVLHFSVAFLFLDLWILFASLGVLPYPSSLGARIVICTSLLWIAYGVARAQRITVRTLDLILPASETNAARPPIRLVAVADIHAGGTVGRNYLHHLQKRIEECGPDILLLLGDVTDGDIPCALEVGLDTMLSELEAPLGKYAVLGNHDLYAGRENASNFLRNAGFVVLEDACRSIDNTFALIGRNDPRGIHFGISRSPLASLVAENETRLPVIVADHTPQNLDEAFQCSIFLQLSGHTHGGQVFPFNLMMRFIYGIASGVLTLGTTTICVSSGAGVWTMPLRTVTNSEIVLCLLSSRELP